MYHGFDMKFQYGCVISCKNIFSCKNIYGYSKCGKRNYYTTSIIRSLTYWYM